MRSIATYIGEESSVQRPSITSNGPRLNGLKRAASETRRQNFSRASRAPERPAFGIAVGEHRGIHGACRRAGNAVDSKPGLFQQTIEHAPGERPMRASALQGEIDKDGIALDGRIGRFWGISPHGWEDIRHATNDQVKNPFSGCLRWRMHRRHRNALSARTGQRLSDRCKVYTALRRSHARTAIIS